MTLTRRSMLQHIGASTLAFSPMLLPEETLAATPPKGKLKLVPKSPPRVHTTSSMHPQPAHHVKASEHLHKHHKYRHHHKHPHYKASSMRARCTLNTPGNRHDLALTMWGEARGYGELGMRCIGHVIMNRVLADEHALGHGIHGVCHKHKQFSCWNANDPNYHTMMKLHTMDESNPDWVAWVKADALAGKILAGIDKDNTAGATYYFAASIVTPYWLHDMVIIGVQFGHTFCKRKHHVSHSHKHVHHARRLVHHDGKSHVVHPGHHFQ